MHGEKIMTKTDDETPKPKDEAKARGGHARSDAGR
jgi:hypothetical protein